MDTVEIVAPITTQKISSQSQKIDKKLPWLLVIVLPWLLATKIISIKDFEKNYHCYWIQGWSC